VITPLIELIANEPGMAERLLALHVDDNTGHCAGCVQHDRPAVEHLCVIRNHALHASWSDQRSRKGE